MNEKDKELIKSLSALLSKLKKLIHFGSAFFHHPSIEDKQQPDDSSPSHKDVNLVKTTFKNDATGENAVGSILKDEKLTKQDN